MFLPPMEILPFHSSIAYFIIHLPRMLKMSAKVFPFRLQYTTAAAAAASVIGKGWVLWVHPPSYIPMAKISDSK